MAIGAVLFDAGGTLVFPNWQRIAASLADSGVAVGGDALEAAEPAGRALFEREPEPRHTRDASRARRYMRAVARAAGVVELPDAALERVEALHRENNLWDRVPDDVVPALDALSGAYRLALVSNSNGTVRSKLERVGLARFFEVVVDSHEEGIEKPDPRLFALALERMGRGARAGESVYVGDLYDVDVLGAQGAGLAAILIDPHHLSADRPCPRIARLAELPAAIERLAQAR